MKITVQATGRSATITRLNMSGSAGSGLLFNVPDFQCLAQIGDAAGIQAGLVSLLESEGYSEIEVQVLVTENLDL
jgi:hypothetical protein